MFSFLRKKKPVVTVVPEPSKEERERFLKEQQEKKEGEALQVFIAERQELAPKEQLTLCLRDAGLPPDLGLLLNRPYCLDTRLRRAEPPHWQEMRFGRVLGVSIEKNHILLLDLSTPVFSENRQIRFDCYRKDGWVAPWGSRWDSKLLEDMVFCLV